MCPREQNEDELITSFTEEEIIRDAMKLRPNKATDKIPGEVVQI